MSCITCHLTAVSPDGLDKTLRVTTLSDLLRHQQDEAGVLLLFW